MSQTDNVRGRGKSHGHAWENSQAPTINLRGLHLANATWAENIKRNRRNLLLHYLSSRRPWMLDLKVVPLPENTSMVMAGLRGRDQVVNEVVPKGWYEFEPPLPELFRVAVERSDGMVLDVGANTGFYSLLAARVPGQRHIIAWEPMPDIRGVLLRNIAANRLRKTVTVIGGGVSDKAGQATLFIPDPRHGRLETSASLNPAFKPHVRTIQIAVTPLDDLLSHRHRVGVIKIDVEGHEAAVLRGALRLIARDRPVVFIEILPGAEVAFMAEFIRDQKYIDVPLSLDMRWTTANAVAHVPDAWNHAFVPREMCRTLFGEWLQE